jgi:hypothetical protein
MASLVAMPPPWACRACSWDPDSAAPDAKLPMQQSSDVLRELRPNALTRGHDEPILPAGDLQAWCLCCDGRRTCATETLCNVPGRLSSSARHLQVGWQSKPVHDAGLTHAVVPVATQCVPSGLHCTAPPKPCRAGTVSLCSPRPPSF